MGIIAVMWTLPRVPLGSKQIRRGLWLVALKRDLTLLNTDHLLWLEHAPPGLG
jgi:hypothetical protein